MAVVGCLSGLIGQSFSVAAVRSVAYLHGVVLLVAIHHTVQGRGRFEFDVGSWVISAIGWFVAWLLLRFRMIQNEN